MNDSVLECVRVYSRNSVGRGVVESSDQVWGYSSRLSRG